MDGLLAFADLRYRFYGAGADAGMNGTSVPIVQKAVAFAPELLFQTMRGAFLGLRYRGVRVETALDTMSAPPEIAALIGNSIPVTSSGLGPKATIDTRDNEMSPSSGTLVELRANFAEEALGSDFTYQTYDLGGNYYRRAGPGVLALRAYLCKASELTPLFDLCLYGSGGDLRGYEVGRFRDRAMATAQGRVPFSARWPLRRRRFRRHRQGGALLRRDG